MEVKVNATVQTNWACVQQNSDFPSTLLAGDAHHQSCRLRAVNVTDNRFRLLELEVHPPCGKK